MNGGARQGPAVLAEILGEKRREIDLLLASPRREAPRRASPPGVVEALRRPPGGDAPLRLVAEVKLRSPSAGELSRALAPAERALAYARGGARMISVLCDRRFFGGGFEDLAACRAALDAVHGPDDRDGARPRLLCKEFIVHPVQLERAAAAGADAALLIARIVTPDELVALAAAARSLDVEPLIEVATEDELADAVRAGARVIGVNARDLDTLVMDPARAARVLAAIAPESVAVYLSGLSGPDDVARVAWSPGRRADAALIGEALMRRDDPGPLLAAMVRAAASHLRK